MICFLPPARVARATAVGFLILAGGTWSLAQQAAVDQAPPVFTARTELIQVDVSVLDSRRRPVRGLTAADFTVFEDGQPRPIETFVVVDLPERARVTEAAWTSAVPADVTTNQVANAEGRLLVILMDRTIPAGMPTLTAREIATAAVNELGPGDLAALVTTGGGVPQNFTSDRQRLLRAITQRDWATGSSAESQEIDDRVHALAEGVFTPLTDGRCLCGLCVPDAITRVADALEHAPRRRKSLLFIGSDFIVQAGPQVQQAELGCGQKLEDAREKMFAALDRSGVVVHGVDPSGLNSIGPTSQASSTLGGRGAALARSRAVEQTLQSQNNLHVVPDHTGGRTVANTNAPQARVPDIVRESESYYLIGFRPSDAPSKRSTRSIDVRVNRRDVSVRARRQYVVSGIDVATAGAASDVVSPVATALNGLLPNATLPLDLHVSAFATPGADRATVVASIGVDAFAPAAGAAARDTPLEVIVAAFDQTGRPQASARQSLELSWPPAGPDAPARVEALMHLALVPGDYDIRVAVENARAQQVASVHGYVTVPAFAGTPLSLSHIVVDAPRTTSSVPRDALTSLLSVVPTTQRVFGRSEAASAFVRIYQGTRRTEALEPVGVRVKIVDAQDRTVRDEGLVLGPDAFASGRAADCRLAIPVARLEPGSYLLSIEAALGERVAGRAMRFEVE